MELILKDGKKINVENGKNGHDVALSIADSLAKASIAYKLNDHYMIYIDQLRKMVILNLSQKIVQKHFIF